MNTEEEISKLYDASTKSFEIINEILKQLDLMAQSDKETTAALMDSLQGISSASTNLAAKVQVLEEEILSIKKQLSG